MNDRWVILSCVATDDAEYTAATRSSKLARAWGKEKRTLRTAGPDHVMQWTGLHSNGRTSYEPPRITDGERRTTLHAYRTSGAQRSSGTELCWIRLDQA